MANNIKGITIQIDADGTPLERAINDINKESQALSSELRTINNQLKFDPQNTVILQQKFDVLGEQIQKTKTKLETLEDAQAKVKEQYENGEIDDGQYRAFQRELEKTKNYLENLEDQQNDVTDALTRADLSNRYEDLQGQISETQAHLEELQAQQDAFSDTDVNSEAYTELADEIASVSTELEGLQAEAESVQGELDNLNSTSSGTADEMGRVGDSMANSRTSTEEASSWMQQLSGAMSSASSQAGMLGGAIGGVISGSFEGLIDLAGQVVQKIVEMAQAFDEANSVIVEKTGASGEALEDFKRIASETAIVVDGLDVSGTAGVVGELNTRLDITGEDLERLTILVGKFADVTGTDAEGSVVRVTKIMKAWGVEVEDVESLLDKMVVAGQKSGISVDSLADDLITYKFQLQEAGFTLDESIALLSSFEKNAINSSTVLRGFTTATGKWAKEGKTAQEGYRDLIESMERASSTQEAVNIAIEYFGKRPAQELTFALESGALASEEFTTALQESQGALMDTEERSQTFADNMEGFGDILTNMIGEGGLPGIFIDTANNVGFLGTTINGMIGSLFGLQEAQQGLIDQGEAMTEQTDMMDSSFGELLAQTLFLTDAQKDAVAQYRLLQEEQNNEQQALKTEIDTERLAELEYDSMIKHQDSVIQSLAELKKSYEDSYNSAYDNINKEVGLFEYMDMSGRQSIDELIGSLDSQISFMYGYASNIRKAMEMGVDKGIVEKLSDGSVESARILQTIVDEGEGKVDLINEKLGLVEAGKSTFSDEFAQMHTNFDTEMGKIEARMYLAVGRMDQYSQAYGNGSNTVKGFIAGSESHYDEIYTAYKKVAETANRAVKNTLDIHSPSRVMMKLGEQTAEGFADGILKEIDIVENAMTKMATPDIRGMGDMAVTKTSRVVSVNAPIQVLQRLDDAEIDRVGGKITSYVSREMARSVGGRL